MDNLNVNNEVQEEAVVAENEADVEVYEEKKPSSIFGLVSMISAIAAIAIVVLSWVVALGYCCCCTLCFAYVIEIILAFAHLLIPVFILVSVVFAIIAFVKKSGKLFAIIGLAGSALAVVLFVIQVILAIIGGIVGIINFFVNVAPALGSM